MIKQMRLLTIIFFAFLVTILIAPVYSAVHPAQIDQALSENPAFKKGEELYSRLKLKEAAEQYREAVRQMPDAARAHERLGAALAGMEDYDAAIIEQQTAIKLDPKYFLPHVILGQIYSNQDKTDLALEEFKQAVA